MIFHLGRRQNVRLAILSAAALTLGLCTTIASIEPTHPADEQGLDDSVSPPTLSASGKIVNRLDAAGDFPEEIYPRHSEAMFVSGFEFFPSTQDVSLGLGAIAGAEERTSRVQARSLAATEHSRSTTGQSKLAAVVIPPPRPKDLRAAHGPVVATAEAKGEPTQVPRLTLPRVVSATHTAIVQRVVAWSGTISQMVQGL